MKWLRMLAVALLLGTAMAAGVMLHNLGRYEKAGVCSSSATVSRDCVARPSGTIVSPPEYERECTNNGNCSDVYHVTARTDQGKNLKFKLIDAREDLKKGSAVELVLWNGGVIAVNANGRESHIEGWEPGMARFGVEWTIPILIVSAALVAFMRKTPDKPKSRFVRVLGYVALTVGGAFGAYVTFSAFLAFLYMGLLV